MINQSREKSLKNFLILPSVLILLCFLFVFFYGVYLSFTDLKLGKPTVNFAGFKNYIYLWKNPLFWKSTKLTIYFTLVSVVVQAFLGVLLAKLFSTKVILAKVFRPIILLPLVLPPMSVALMWTTMMNPERGVLNYFLSLFGIEPFMWISQYSTAMLSVIFIDVWTYTPFFTLIIYAGLLGVNQEMKEAAQEAGASAWTTFWKIELPFMMPYVLIAAVFRIIESFNQFDIFIGTTGGGPAKATTVYSIYAYIQSFQNLNFGRGTAILFVNWWLVLIGALITIKFYQMARMRVS